MSRFLLVASATVAIAGCSSGGSCHCPAGGAFVDLAPDVEKTVVDVTGDTCGLATGDPSQGVYLNATKGTTCHVRIVLANGEVLTTTVTFSSLGGCCSSVYYGADASEVVRADGGTSS